MLARLLGFSRVFEISRPASRFLDGRTKNADVFPLVHDWLEDERKGPWAMSLDNINDTGFLKSPSPSIDAEATEAESADPRQLYVDEHGQLGVDL